MKEYFWYRENPDDTYSILPMYRELKEDWRVCNTFNVFPARLLGLEWTDYLRYCIKCGAEVTGKEHIYPVIKWKKKNKEFLDELNRRANLLIKI